MRARVALFSSLLGIAAAQAVFVSAPTYATTTPVTKVLTIVLENHGYDQMRSGMPYLWSQATRYGYASSYKAIARPSLPNYLAIAGGSTFGVTDDAWPSSHVIRGASVFGQARAAGKTAKVYAETMSSNCQATGSTWQGYAVKHNAWPYFADERSGCGSYDVPSASLTSGALAADVAAGTLPNAGMLVPNLCNDAHDCSLSTADSWLKGWLPRLVAGPDFTAGRLVIVVTADEASKTDTTNRVLTVVMQKDLHGIVATRSLTHYSLTRLYGSVLGTPFLRNAATAPSLRAAFGLTVS